MSNRRIDGNIIDTFVNRNQDGENISSITYSVDNETDERIQADANLQSQIDQINQTIDDGGVVTNERFEILEEEVAQLQIDLTTETNNRISADNNLQSQITTTSNNLTTETNNRISADNNLQSQITTLSNNTTYTTTVIIKEYTMINGINTWTGRYKFNVKPSTSEEIYDLKYFNDSINTINGQIAELNDDTADLYDSINDIEREPDASHPSTKKLFGVALGIGMAGGLAAGVLMSLAGKVNWSTLTNAAYQLTENVMEYAQDTMDNMRRGQRIRLPDANDPDGDVEMEFFEEDPLLPQSEQTAGMRFGEFGGSFI